MYAIVAAILLAADPVPPEVTAGEVPPLPTPIEFTATVGKIIQLNAKGDKPVRWELARESADKVLFAPAGDGLSAQFAAMENGRYLVFCISAVGDRVSPAARYVVAVGPPIPKPDDPPKPLPPDDPLAAKLKAAYLSDAGADKAKQLADLAALYRLAIDLAKDPQTVTAGQLAERVRVASGTLKITGLVEVRKAIAGELSLAFPDPDEPLTDASRGKLATLFGRISAALTAANPQLSK